MTGAGRPSGARVLAYGVGLVGLYVALAAAGRELGQLGSLSIWHPPAGLAFAAGALAGPWAIVPLAVGELVAGIVVFDTGDTFTVLQMAVSALGYSGIYVATATVVRRLGPGRRAATALAIRVPLLFSGILIAAPLAAAFGVAIQRWAGADTGTSTSSAVGMWWVGDAVGIANVGAAIYVAYIAVGGRRRGASLLPPALKRDSGAVVLTLLASPTILAAVVFEVRPDGIAFIALLFVPMTLVALRYGGMGAAASGLLVGPIVTAVANRHTGEIVLVRTDLQMLLLSALVVSLIVGAVVDERERASRHDHERSEIVDGMAELVALVGRDGRFRYLNSAGRRMLGLSADADIRSLTEEDFAVDELAAEATAAARRSAEDEGMWSGEVRLRGPEGREMIGAKRVLTHRNPAGQVIRWTTLVRDVTEERRLERALARAAVEDSLTGLANRSYMVTLAQATIEACVAGRGGSPLLLVKIDRIAMLMGALGIELADEMLREVARRLLALAGPAVSVARLEGVTFGLLPNDACSDEEGLDLAERVVVAIKEPLVLGDRTVPISCSVGVTSVDGTCTVAEAIRAADVAAVRAQEAGGGRVVRHEATMTDGATDRLALEAALDAAVRERTWRLDYQPIADMRTGELVAVEALLRFPSDLPTFPLVLLAEANGLIVPLGRDLLEDACRTVAGWGDELAHVGLHVNVSGRQLAEPGFVELVRSIFETTGIAANRVTLELTETAVIDDLTVAGEVIDGLVALGARTALDDFGTGQSSLQVLASLAFDILKLDHFLTIDVVESQRARSIVAATVEFAKVLDLVVVAEGVERLDQHDVLRDLGCDLVQGYMLAPALRAEEIVRRWAEPRSAADHTL